MTYGMPYKGSKNKIAEQIVDIFSNAQNFYDLFAGGFAITHRALVSRKFENIIANDIDSSVVELFRRAIKGEFKDEKRWISRDDFFRLKSVDPYIAYVWSFGNNGRDYLYEKEIEPWKRALHYARVYNDSSLLNEFGIDSDGSSYDIRQHHDDYKVAYTNWYIEKFKICPDVGNRRLNELQSLESLKRLQSLESLKRLQRLESLERLQRLQRLQSLERLSILNCSYDDICIMPNSVIYCDIPYKSTNKYNCGNFDYEKFYNWCAKQTEPLFISEYNMPDDFICLSEIKHRSTLGNNKSAIERVFTHKNNVATKYKQMIFEQMSLFG